MENVIFSQRKDTRL